jgi:hypothetical protein
MACSGQASSPKGIATSAASAMGMMIRLTSGSASRLVKTP